MRAAMAYGIPTGRAIRSRRGVSHDNGTVSEGLGHRTSFSVSDVPSTASHDFHFVADAQNGINAYLEKN